jgi:hypothetical protein
MSSMDDVERQILAKVEARTREAEQRPAEVGSWRDGLMETRGRGTAAAGRVVAEVDLQGLLTGLAVSDIVAQRGGREASRSILAAITAAHEDVRSTVQASGAGMWGEGSPTAGALNAEVRADNPLLHEPDDATPPPRRGTEGTW